MLTLKERINLVLSQNPEMVVSRAEAQNHPGFTAEQYAELGLDKAQLKKLEAKGFALRGYTKNVWTEGDTLPNGKKADGRYHGKGHKAKYILVVAE